MSLTSQVCSRKCRLPIWFVALLAILVAIIYCHFSGNQADAEFLIRFFSTFGVMVAVIMALFGNQIRGMVDQLDLCIALPSETDSFHNVNVDRNVYTHHLRVKNQTSPLPVRNCRVWLVSILDQFPDGSFQKKLRFAVPRLMEWAPKEWSNTERSFAEDQVFDFGHTYLDDKYFRPQFLANQGGTWGKDGDAGDCKCGQRRRYGFRIEADNFIRAHAFFVEVTVKEVTPSADWEWKYRAFIDMISDGEAATAGRS